MEAGSTPDRSSVSSKLMSVSTGTFVSPSAGAAFWSCGALPSVTTQKLNVAFSTLPNWSVA